MKKVTCIMAYRLRYFCILVYLMHDVSILLVAIQALCSNPVIGETEETKHPGASEL